MAHRPKNPAIPMRDGVSPSCVALPRMRTPPWATVLEHLAQRLTAVSLADWRHRMAAGQVVGEGGEPLAPETPYQNGLRVYYWRELPEETPVPFTEHIVFQDAHLVVADKPHFLPVTPGGRYVRESLLVRLKQRLNLPDLSPLHRIDRETAGLVVFSVRPQDRDAYQALFRDRRIHKTYHAVAAWRSDLAWPHTRRSHILEDEQAFYRMREARPEEGLAPNSETVVDLLERRGLNALYRLTPVSGKRHQLRVHMNGLGLPLRGDRFYPVVRHGPEEDGGFDDPLQLLAQHLAFEDPVTGEVRGFTSQRQLNPLPLA